MRFEMMRHLFASPTAVRTSRMAGLVVVLLASGCVETHQHHGYIIDKTLLQSVMPGVDNRFSVEQTLGRPTFASQFGQKNWYYISENTRQPPFRGPHPVKETVLRVRFDAQDNVIAVSSTGIDRMIHITPNGDITPTMGNKRTLLEDLFGNIGTVGAAGMSTPGGAPNGGGGGGGGGGSGGAGPNGS